MLINEFFPNPVGKDADGEWIELFNNSQETINLNGWQIKDASGKTFIFKNQTINPAEYLVLDYKTTKISLNNSDETLFLYDQKGVLINKAEFSDAAPEGKSLIRQNNQFKFTDQPTPGKINVFKGLMPSSGVTRNQLTAITSKNISPSPTKIQSQLNFNHLIIGFILALILSALFIIIFKKLNPE